MARNSICHACEIGDHKHHHRVIRAVSDGMIGGVVCGCKGECQDPATIKRRREAFLRRLGLSR